MWGPGTELRASLAVFGVERNRGQALDRISFSQHQPAITGCNPGSVREAWHPGVFCTRETHLLAAVPRRIALSHACFSPFFASAFCFCLFVLPPSNRSSECVVAVHQSSPRSKLSTAAVVETAKTAAEVLLLAEAVAASRPRPRFRSIWHPHTPNSRSM